MGQRYLRMREEAFLFPRVGGGDLESRVGSPGHEDRTLSRKGGALHVGQYKGYCAASFYALRTGSL